MKSILVNRVRITGRFPDKKGDEPKTQIIAPGTHMTDGLIKKFGLDKDGQIEALIKRGHVVERNAFVVDGKDGGASAEQLAAETARADAAEAKVAEHEATIASLTEQLEAATALAPADAPAKA